MKFIRLFIILITIISCGTRITKNNYKQSKVENSNSFDHIKHIRQESQKSIFYQRGLDRDMDKNMPKYFVDYIIKNSLKNPEHKKYITDRKLLRKLKNNICWENYILIRDSLDSGDKCEIEIKLQDFDKRSHEIVYDKENDFINKIDGKYPFGAIYYTSKNELKSLKELKSLTIKINGTEINTKIEEYRNLYNPNFCEFGMNIRIIEAYEDGENLYIYLFGGESSSSYFSKLIFNKKEFITSITVDYVPMSIYSSFGENFIGF
ncbi:hypothetical protein [Tenacibaculum amylolyticum]|uniref:hypothetical protein n=1 Tax=Tenacibaculum amylolyticum TaxID=104269 RepID=UPI00389676CD